MPGDTENLYESEDPSMAPGKPPMDDKAEGESGNSFLVPSEICPGMEPGEEMVVKIKAVHDDQYEITYAPKAEKKESAPEMDGAAPASGEDGGEPSMYE